MKAEPSFPLEVPSGSTVVRVFRRVSKSGYESFTIAYYKDGSRKREVLSDLAKAKKRAKKIAEALAKGETVGASIKLQDQRTYVNSKKLIRPTGLTLEAGCRELAEIYKVLKPFRGVSGLAVAKDYAKRHERNAGNKSVQEVVSEFLAAKEEGRATRLRGNGRMVSEKYLYQLRLKLETFADKLSGLIGNVTSEAINDFLAGMKKASGRTKNNYVQALNVLFEFARKERYVPRDHDVMDEVDSAAETDFDIEIFTPDELARLLMHCPAPLAPVLVLGAFAGLRTAEIERLDWSEINLKSLLIEVKAKKAKTRARRLVPITPNLAAWLDSFRSCTTAERDQADGHPTEGPVWPHSLPYLFELQRDTAADAGVTWKHNALRHSYISYRVAAVKNVAQVALEAGNSPDIIFQHYRELVTKEAATGWFGITPAVVKEAKQKAEKELAAKVVPITAGQDSEAAALVS
jgi:integrase